MGSKPKKPEPVAPQTQMFDLTAEGDKGGSNFEEELRRLRQRSQTVKAGETGGYGGNTQTG